MKYTNEELIITLQNEYADSGKIPLSKGKRGIDVKQFQRRFGSWSEALTAAGIPLRKHKQPTILEKVCPNCNENFNTTEIRKKTFCTIKCSNESRRKRAWKPKRTRTEWLDKVREDALKKMMDASFNDLGWDTKRKRVIYEQSNKCSKCGLTEWMGETLSLEVDHIDGNNTNDVRVNLTALCPNCHSITPTWRGKNKACNKITDDELTQALKEKDNIRQALLSVGMAAKGANYRRATRLLEGLNKYEQIK